MATEILSSLLQSSSGRDAVYRLVSYSSLMVSGIGEKLISSPSQWTMALERLSTALSDFRVMKRLGDDLSMAMHTKRYGLGRQVSFSFVVPRPRVSIDRFEVGLQSVQITRTDLSLYIVLSA